MEIEFYNLTATVHDVDGTEFTLDDQLQKWGYIIRRNGGIDKKNNQAMVIYSGPTGRTRSVDNNGTVNEWRNGAWVNIVKDNKPQADNVLLQDGQPAIFSKAVNPKPTIDTSPLLNTIKDASLNADKVFLEKKFAEQQILPGENTMTTPATANSPVIIPQLQTDIPAAGGPLKATGFSFTSPWVIGGMLVGIVALFFIAKKFKG